MNEKIKIYTDSGELVEASAPVIISASRSTDIPAFLQNGSLTVLQKGIVLGIIHLISRKCIFHSKTARL